MKQQLPPGTHDRHDATLIARLYGDDLNSAERERAVSLIADCADCAALFADFGAIAGATKLLPVPPRPRDFTLTEEDAARLSRPAGIAKRFTWLGARRSFGGALAALGLVGLLLSGTSSVFDRTSGSSDLHETGNQNALDVGTTGPAALPAAGSQGLIAMASPAPAATAVNPAATGIAAVDGGQSQTPGGKSAASAAPPSTQAGPSSEGLQPRTSAQAPGTGTGTVSTANGDGTTFGKTSGPSSNGSGGFDPRRLGFFGFGLALLLGIGLLTGPRLRRLASRRPAR